MIKNQAGQSIGAQLVSAITGAAFVGAVTVYVTGDAGTQAIGTVGAGICTHEGRGYYTYLPSQDETNYELVAFTFTAPGAISATVQVYTITSTIAATLGGSGVAISGAITRSARDLVSGALRLLGVIDAVDGGLEPEDLDAGFNALNEFMEYLSTQRQLIFVTTPTTHNLAAGQASYTIGVGGNFNQARPIWLPSWGIIPDPAASPVVTVPRGRPLTLTEWNQIAVKSTLGTYPQAIYFDHAWNAGLGKIYVYPVPDSSTPDIVLDTPSALSSFADLTTGYTFPPGYARALRYGLAVELADDYPGSLTEKVEDKATKALAQIKRANFRPNEAQFDPMLSGQRGSRYDIYTG